MARGSLTFGVLYVFVVLSLERRRVLHINVTNHPHAGWTAQQLVEALGYDATPARLVRDRDRIYGAAFNARIEHIGIEQLKTAPRSPCRTASRNVGWGHCGASCSIT